MAKTESPKHESNIDTSKDIDVSKLTSPSPAERLSEIIGNTNKTISRKTIFTAMAHANGNTQNGNGKAHKQLMEDPKMAGLDELQELMKNAQTLTFDVGKYRKDLHIRDISRKVDGCIKGGSLNKDGTVKEGSRAKNGLAMVYVEKPNTAVILMEHEPGSVHDLKNVLNCTANGDTASLFKPFLPVPFLGRNIKREGALCQGWGCISLVDGNMKSQRTEVKIAILEADIKTNIIAPKPKPVLWMSDITRQISKTISKSRKKNGNVVVCTPHTTVGITVTKPELVDDFKKTLNGIAPDNIAYKHNRTAGDNNGRSHLMAEFIGDFVLLRLKNGTLQLSGNRIYAVDCDVQIPREREIITAII